MTWAHHALLENDRQGLKYGLILTILLGATFTCVQAFEYSHAAFHFSGNIYGATFFMATGFHGFHVLIGTIFLIVCLLRAYAGQFTPTQHLGFEFAAWYWHFVDVVWLFLFICIYVWGHGAETMAQGAHNRSSLLLQGGGRGAALFVFRFSGESERGTMDMPGQTFTHDWLRARCAGRLPMPALRPGQALCGFPRRCGRTAKPAGSTMPLSKRRWSCDLHHHDRRAPSSSAAR